MTVGKKWLILAAPTIDYESKTIILIFLLAPILLSEDCTPFNNANTPRTIQDERQKTEYVSYKFNKMHTQPQ